MQHTSAFSPPKTVPAVPSTVPKQSPWILSSWRDLLLYVATPLLLVPMFALAQARWSAQDIYVFVAAFGATGHHLPGMIRAYGDRALFERFRWRFILAPIFLVVVCTAFTWWEMKGLILIVFFWGVWHGMMQTYGFCRIYDAKMGSFAALTRRIDFATCAIWFAAAVLLSSQRMSTTLDTYYASGAPYISGDIMRVVQQIVWVAAIAISIVFLSHFAWMWVKGKRPNPVKLALLATSIAFWWYCNNGVTNILAGIALFEVFHDVQYLSLVWIYNRRRVEKDSSIGGFMRFVFRRSGSLVGLYIGLVFAYGMLGYVAESRHDIETMKRVLTGLVAASGLLHFYYDGFIWKVREQSTRESLGLEGGITATGVGRLIPSWVGHGAKWVVAFVIPLAVLWIGQQRGAAPHLQRQSWIVEAFPNNAAQRFYYATALGREGRAAEAAEQFRVGLNLDPKDAEAHYGYAQLLVAQSNIAEAASHFEKAIQLNPTNGGFHSDYASLLEQLGRRDEAAKHHQSALRLSPDSATVHHKYGVFLGRQGKLDEAIAEFRAALQHQPQFADAEVDLGTMLYQQYDLEGAKKHYEAALRLDPTRANVLNYLGIIHMRQGQPTEAAARFREALRLQPDFFAAADNLRLAEQESTFGVLGSTPR